MTLRIWLLCGLAFAGKTTLCRTIVGLTGADEINAERGLWGGEGVADEEWARTHRIALSRADEALASGRDVVVDDTNCFRWLRDDYRDVAGRHGAHSVVVVLDVPLAEIRDRMARNEDLETRRGLRPEIMQRLIDTFEWPTEDENVMTAGELVAELRSRG